MDTITAKLDELRDEMRGIHCTPRRIGLQSKAKGCLVIKFGRYSWHANVLFNLLAAKSMTADSVRNGEDSRRTGIPTTTNTAASKG